MIGFAGRTIEFAAGAVLLSGALTPAACHARTPAKPAASTECTATAPAEMAKGTVRWFGTCVKGRAHGYGVLRSYTKSGAADAFYGQIANGSPLIGVLETPEGYVFGRFVKGVAQRSSDRQYAVDAFRAATAGARAASAQFTRAGNKGSADFYARKAEQLDNALD